MDLVTILKIIIFVMLVVIGILLVINRKAENQNMARLSFVILLVMFIFVLVFFK